MKTITLEPEWEGVLRWWGQALSTHSFEPGAWAPIVSFVEQVLYLQGAQPEAFRQVLEEWKAKAAQEEAARVRLAARAAS